MENLNQFDLENPSFEKLIEGVKDKSVVLIGESSHGTQEFYQMRAAISKELIKNHGFSAVCLESDWPDTFRLNEYVKSQTNHSQALSAFDWFQRFPLWMWRNRATVDFVEWLYKENLNREEQCGIFGLDLYGINNSINEVIDILESIDPDYAREAKELYSCLDLPLREPQKYGAKVSRGFKKPCEDEVIEQLLKSKEIIKKLKKALLFEDSDLDLELNSLAIASGESYYRELFNPSINTWNIRDGHMMKCLNKVVEHEKNQKGRKGKVIVWAHNSHVGDHRGREKFDREEITLGGIVKEQYEDSALIGMTTCRGSVTAAPDWGEGAHFYKLNEAREDSHAYALSKLSDKPFYAPTNKDDFFKEKRLERAVGVIYRPDTERRSHYFKSILSESFDWIIHIPETQALDPIDQPDSWILTTGGMDTYPSGF